MEKTSLETAPRTYNDWTNEFNPFLENQLKYDQERAAIDRALYEKDSIVASEKSIKSIKLDKSTQSTMVSVPVTVLSQ